MRPRGPPGRCQAERVSGELMTPGASPATHDMTGRAARRRVVLIGLVAPRVSCTGAGGRTPARLRSGGRVLPSPPQIQHWAETPIACPHACCYSRGAFRPRGGDAWPAPKAGGSYLCGPSGWLRAEATLPLDVGDRSEEDGFEPPREDADAGCCSAPYRAERSPAWVWPLAA
jgi:hypothetical protein